jgi:retron-type reverse transcriptase
MARNYVGGSPTARFSQGIDGMTVDDLPQYLQHHRPEICARLVAGCCRPHPLRRVDIPEPDGTKRPLGVPTVLDRFIQQAVGRVVQRNRTAMALCLFAS